MDLTGLVHNIVNGTLKIDKGRKYLATDNLEHAGRLSYEDGISIALDTFKNTQAPPLTRKR